MNDEQVNEAIEGIERALLAEDPAYAHRVNSARRREAVHVVVSVRPAGCRRGAADGWIRDERLPAVVDRGRRPAHRCVDRRSSPARRAIAPVTFPLGWTSCSTRRPGAPTLRTEDFTVRFGGQLGLFDVTVAFPDRAVTSVIGPSGSGKSTLLRGCNRLVEFVEGATVEGTVWLGDQDVYGPGVDPTTVRREIGIVFEKPNPFGKSVFDNVAYGPRTRGMRRDLEPVVEQALVDAGLWDEVRDDLHEPGPDLVARPAAAAVPRPGIGRTAVGAAARRAVLGARPRGHAARRGTSAPARRTPHDRPRHP